MPLGHYIFQRGAIIMVLKFKKMCLTIHPSICSYDSEQLSKNKKPKSKDKEKVSKKILTHVPTLHRYIQMSKYVNLSKKSEISNTRRAQKMTLFGVIHPQIALTTI